ncbi:MAG TPA: hypothetical protein VN783_00820 [Thermoanaerobaculia bacterium]|nr:hypothetical protein [Thermoanaerobaculia bacterium]
MFLDSPASARWRNATLVALAATIAYYVRSARREFPHGGSRTGVALGVLAVAAIAVLLYFGVRKRSYRSRFGRLETWLLSHVYLGLLSFVFVLLHTGFRFHDRLALSAFAVLILVVATGIWGALLYQRVPRLLSEVETNLPPERVSEQLNQFASAMARLASGRSDAFRAVYLRLLGESLPGALAGWRILAGGASKERQRDWSALLARVGADEQGDLRQLLVLSRQRRVLHRRFVIQKRAKNLLEVWLYLHVPLSIALVALVAAHLISVFYFARL